MGLERWGFAMAAVETVLPCRMGARRSWEPVARDVPAKTVCANWTPSVVTPNGTESVWANAPTHVARIATSPQVPSVEMERAVMEKAVPHVPWTAEPVPKGLSGPFTWCHPDRP